jgi:anti-sigma regulatory factor (Ser/Thr protein kinase)
MMETRSLPAELNALAEIRRFVKEAASGAGIEESRSYRLQLAVDEIATNIILYGYKDASEGAVISIGAEATGDALVITLRDQSPPFDPRTMQLPEAQDLARPLEERQIGGLGIYLALQGVDHFEYRHEYGSNLNIFEVRSGHE